MIAFALSVLLYASTHQPPPPVGHRHEVCAGATHFYEKHHPKPYWYRDMQVVCVIGNHVFMKEKPRRPHEKHRS